MKLLISLLFGFAVLATHAQTATPELISSSGDSYSNASYQLDWSVGEISTETYSNDDNVLTQGFHQGIYVITDIYDNPFSNINISVFPNPTLEFIHLKIESQKIENLNFIITDLSGRVLQSGNLIPEKEKIDFSNYAAGTYFIIVSQNYQILKSFKIIKTK